MATVRMKECGPGRKNDERPLQGHASPAERLSQHPRTCSRTKCFKGLESIRDHNDGTVNVLVHAVWATS
jgi:hypothetical protein